MPCCIRRSARSCCRAILSLPVGTELSVAIEPALPTLGAATGPSMPQSLFALSRGWPSLADAIALLRAPAGNPVGTQPALDTSAALARLPQTGNRLAAGIVAAIQALGAGDVEALLGSLASLRQASAGREESARKLRQEFAQISAQAQDKAGVDWRCFFIPIMDDGTIRQINLFYRRDRGKKDKGEVPTRAAPASSSKWICQRWARSSSTAWCARSASI